jgi:hypothetical protein
MSSFFLAICKENIYFIILCSPASYTAGTSSLDSCLIVARYQLTRSATAHHMSKFSNSHMTWTCVRAVANNMRINKQKLTIKKSQCVTNWFEETIVNTGIKNSRIHMNCIMPICFQELMKQTRVPVTQVHSWSGDYTLYSRALYIYIFSYSSPNATTRSYELSWFPSWLWQ